MTKNNAQILTANEGGKAIFEAVELIKDYKIRMWTKVMFQNSPESFFYAQASKGAHHPKDERLVGGNVRHTIRAFYVMQKLCESMQDEFSEEEQSLMLSAILLHDLCRGLGDDHAEEFRCYYKYEVDMENTLNMYPEIVNMVERHMGRWGKNKPETRMEWLVHIADNIAANAHEIIPYYDKILGFD